MIVMAALTIVIVVMMLMFMLFTVFMMIVLMFMLFLAIMVVVMIVMAALTVVIVVMMLMFSLLFQLCHQLCFQIGCTLDGCKNVLAIQCIPGSGNDGRLGIMLTNELHSLFQLILGNITGSAQDNGSGMLNLIDKELSKILNIHLALGSIYNCYRTV